MINTEKVVPFPIRTKLVCSACGAPGEGTCGCGAPYVKPGERAEAAVKANPDKSDRAIAEEIGVSDKTVGKARKSTAEYSAVKKRTGKDGIPRRMPRMDRAPKKHYAESEIVALADQGKSNDEIAKLTGIGKRQIRHIVEREQTRRASELAALEKLNVDPATLAASAKAKLEVVKRQLEKQLRAEHAERMRGFDEQVRKKVVEGNKTYLEMLREREAQVESDQAWYRKLINDHKAILSKEQFMLLMRCVHGDSNVTEATRTAATQLLNEKRQLLTGERK